VVSIVPWYVGLVVDSATLKHLTVFRALRLLRMLRVERYIPALRILGRLMYNKRVPLFASFFILCIWTLVFATLLYTTEKDNQQVATVSGESMGYRFRNVPSSLFYTFLHLTGDYPLYKYTDIGKVVNFFMILLGQIFAGLPLGILINGFQEAMEGEAAVRAKLLARDAEKRGESMDAIKEKKEEEEEEEEEEVKVKVPVIVGEPTFQQEVFNFVNAVGESAWDKHAFNSLQGGMVALALAVLIVNSNQGWRDQHIGPMEDLKVGGLFTVLGYIAAIFFVLEYLLRLYCCTCDPKFLGQATYSGQDWKNWKWKRLCYATDFTGIVDVVSWLPFFIAQGYSFNEEGYVVWSCIQVLVILKIDRIVPAFTLLDDVLGGKEHSRMLFCTLVVALIAWILFSSVFYLIEQHESNMKGSFADMPLSLFFTMILLGGEWCRVDLEAPWGQLIGFLLALVGIGIIGIPMAVFFDGYSEIAEDYVDNYLAGDGDALCCGPCSPQGERSFCAPVNDCGERVDASLCKADATDHLKQDLRT